MLVSCRRRAQSTRSFLEIARVTFAHTNQPGLVGDNPLARP